MLIKVVNKYGRVIGEFDNEDALKVYAHASVIEYIREKLAHLIKDIEYIVEDGTLPNSALSHPSVVEAKIALEKADKILEDAKKLMYYYCDYCRWTFGLWKEYATHMKDFHSIVIRK